MNRRLLNISGKIDPFSLEIYETLAASTGALKIPYLIVGAAARDILLHYGYGITLTRKTQDIDFGVRVAAWSDYESLKEKLLSSGSFTSSKSEQRVLFKDRIPVDIVPFGDLADQASNIYWPPDKATVMNVLGFEEALSFAQIVCLRNEPPLEVPIVSLAGLAMLKIIAWQDRYPASDKDAQDLFYILKNYLDAGHRDRIYDELPELLDKPEIPVSINWSAM